MMQIYTYFILGKNNYKQYFIILSIITHKIRY